MDATPTMPLSSFLRDPARRRAIGLALIAFTIAVALLVTLYPFRFRISSGMFSRIDWNLYHRGHNDRDLILNLLMLAPLGVGLALWRWGRAAIGRIVLEAAALGVGLALCIETLQILERVRFPQVADIWRNGLGCVVGAAITSLVLRRLELGPRIDARG